MTHLLAMSNWYPRTRLWIWRLPFIMKEFTKTYPSQKMGEKKILQIVVTKASIYNYKYWYTYICYYCTSPDRLNRQQLIIRKKIQWFFKKSKVYCWNLGNKVHWPSNNTIVKCFYFVAIYPIKKKYFRKKKVPNMPGYYNIELFFVSRGAFTKCTLERKYHWIISPWVWRPRN